MVGSHRRGVVAAVLVALALAVAPAAAPAASGSPPPPPPGQDPFYTPPAPLPPGPPGSVIGSRPAVFTLDPIHRTPLTGVRSWQVLYRSTTGEGAPVAISGTVLVPGRPWTGAGPRPLVTYGVGTRGLGDSCAPSYTLSLGVDYEELFIADALHRGFAVVVSDMRGLGTPGQHTYEVGTDQGRALLDAARAAERLPGDGLGARTPVGIMGYSQGGTSAGWAAELAATYAPELAVKGTAAGGVPADLEAVAAKLDGGPFLALALMAGVGYDAAYAELDLPSYLNARGRKLLERDQNLCLLSFGAFRTLLQTAFKHVTDYTTTNPLTTPAWQARLDENRLGRVAPSAPVFQYHGGVDEIIPLHQAEVLRQEWCDEGATVTWKVYPRAEHVLGALFGSAPALDYLGKRFAGAPATGNC